MPEAAIERLRGLRFLLPRWLVLGALLACGSDGPAPPVPVRSVDVTPALLRLQLEGQPTGQLTATARDAGGQTLTGRTITWESLQPAVATVTAAGQVAAVGVGTTTVRATADGVAGTATVEVTLAPVFLVFVSLGSATLDVASTMTATASLRDSTGNVLTGRVVQWSSSNAAVASVNTAGVVTGLTAGTASIIATSEGVAGMAQVRVFDTPPNLALESILVSQAVQRVDGAIPLIAGGHPVLVSVYGTLDRPYRSGLPAPRVRITVFRGADQVLMDERAITGAVGTTTSVGDPIHQVVLASSIAAPSLRLTATINPDAILPEATASDNTWPSTGPRDVPVHTVPPLLVHLVPILLSNGGSVGSVTQATLPEYLFATRQMHPAPAVDATIGNTVSVDVVFGDGQLSAYSGILQTLDMVRVAEGSSRFYVGALRPPPGVSFVQFGGIGYVPFNLQSIGPGTRTAVVVGVGWFARQRQSTELVAHELGHTMGRRHAPCGGAASPDPLYPHPNASIGVYGHDLYSISLGVPGLPTIYAPNGSSDVMSYCNPAWISDYNYAALLQARLTAAAAVASAGAPCECLLVWGSVERDSIRLRPAFAMRTREALPLRPGSYTMTGERGDGRPLFSFTFEPSEIDHAPDVRHFTFAVPLATADRAALARIRVSGRGRPESVLSVRSTTAAAEVSASRGTDDALEVRWNASQFPAAIVRDAGSGAILGLGFQGRLITRPTSGDVEMLLSNGVSSVPIRVRPRPR